MKPYVWRGRFYNNQQDSITWRLRKFALSMLYLSGYRLATLFRRTRLKPCDVEKTDHAATEIVPLSYDPIITWLGHSSFLIQVSGYNILVDPLFFEGFPAFKRQQKLSIALEHFPKIDVVMISHNHKDHLDEKTIRALRPHDPLFLVPQGNRALLERWGCNRIVECSWWDEVTIEKEGQAALTGVFLPAHHWTSRGLFDINKTLWGSWLIVSACQRTIYFAGDTAYDRHFELIRERYGNIEIILMPIGPNRPHALVCEAHVDAHEAVDAFIQMGGKHFIPMHWGTFMRMVAESSSDQLHCLLRAWDQKKNLLQDATLHIGNQGFSIQIKD